MFKELLSLLGVCATLATSAQGTLLPASDISSTLFLVNRQKMITSAYIPETVAANVTGSVRNMRAEAAQALEALFDGATEAGYNLVSVSGYRSYQTQNNIYQRKLQSTGSVDEANQLVALPGASEHQLALAMDVSRKEADVNLTASFGKTPAGIWVSENCWRYGFIIRYKEEWEDVTGYAYEPWHIRYVGMDAAKEIFEQDIPFETYMEALQLRIMQSYLTKEVTGQ